MKDAIRYMAQNHVAANILMLFFLIGGLVLLPTIKQEIFPEISLDIIQIQVAYPGAAPEEVEDGIILAIEQALSGIDGIKEINSFAQEGLGTVFVTVKEGANADRVLQDVKNAVDRITTFPEEAEEPLISKLLNRHEVISVVVYGQVDEWTLKHYAEEIEDELLAKPNITQVSLFGVRPYEIAVEVPQENLKRFHLSFDDLAGTIRAASVDLPGGRLKTEGGEILLRTKGKRYYARQYAGIIVITSPEGTKLRLGDLARVRDTFADVDTYALFDGKPAAMVKVYRVGDQRPLDISRTVREYVQKRAATLPSSLKLAVWNDTSQILRSRMNLLLKNASFGLILVVLILGLFLELRLAFWVMLGIPVSFLGTFLFMPLLHLSINMISLFAFIMALGIVVDDAIVVGESAFARRRLYSDPTQAAIEGTLEVAKPIVFSVLTTIAAFVPLIFVGGMIGKFIKVIPLIVISTLLVSLTESLFVLPAHLSLTLNRPKGRVLTTLERPRLWLGQRLRQFIQGPYKRALKACLTYRYATIAAGLSLLLLSLGLVESGLVRFRFMPAVEANHVDVTIKMPVGTPVRETARVARFIEKKGEEAARELEKTHPGCGPICQHIYTLVGGTLGVGGPVGGGEASAAHLAEVSMLLTPNQQRCVGAEEVKRKWRELVGEIPGVDALTFKANLVHMGANLDIQLAHKDLEVLRKAAERLKKALASYPGLSDIDDTYSEGKTEIKIRLKPLGRLLGLTETQLGRQIRGAFYGSEALRLQRGKNEVKVMVSLPRQDRNYLWYLENLWIKTPQGAEVPLSQVAELVPGRGYSIINRYNRKRVVDVTASVDAKVTNADEILAELKKGLLPQLMNDYPGLSYQIQGEGKEEAESMASMRRGFLLALLAIYSLLAISFRSYIQPLIVMLSIPFGLVGAILGHLIMGKELCILSMFGLVALSGVVVNDALLLIDYANERIRKGNSPFEAIVQAGIRRFRPILLTSLTTFFGLMPLILEKSIQAQFLIPMAISLGFGILFATGITLLLIPCFYLVYEDLRQRIQNS